MWAAMVWFFAGPAVTRRLRRVGTTFRRPIFAPRTASASRKGSDTTEPGMQAASQARSQRVPHVRATRACDPPLGGWTPPAGFEPQRGRRPSGVADEIADGGWTPPAGFEPQRGRRPSGVAGEIADGGW